MNTLNHDNSVPLYIQLKDIIKNDIVSGVYKPNEKIPSEIELSAQFSISRITVRNAINELVDEDLLIKKQGKGTFVSISKIQDNILDDISFSLTCEINKVKAGSKIIKNIIKEASDRDIRELNLNKGDKVIYLKRIRYADEEPIIVEHNFFPYKYNYLLKEDLENQSLYEILGQKYNIIRNKSKKVIEIATASHEEAELLKISIGDPLLLHREIVYDKDYKPIHRTKQLIVGDKFKFIVP